ncbi:MAG: hypothetical protein ABL949_12225 [Fimbriimonadaceae bacterium]
MKRIILLWSLVLVALVAAQGVPLVRKAKVGDSATYDLKMDLVLFGDVAVYTSKMTEKVVEVTPDGTISIEKSQTDYKAQLFGDEATVLDQDMPKPVYSWDSKGVLVGIKSELQKAEVYRMAEFEAVRLPAKAVSVGDTYSVEVAANAKFGTHKAKADYKIEAQEKVGNYDTFVASFTYAEQIPDDPASSTGKVWINKEDGSVVKLEAAWTNVPIPGAPAQTTGNIKLERTG